MHCSIIIIISTLTSAYYVLSDKIGSNGQYETFGMMVHNPLQKLDEPPADLVLYWQNKYPKTLRKIENPTNKPKTSRELNKLFLEMIAKHQEDISLMMIDEKKSEYGQFFISNSSESEIFIQMYGSNICNANISHSDSKLTGDGQILRAQSCPFHKVLTRRLDRYPYLRVNAKCNCKNCLGLEATNSSLEAACLPIITFMPALALDSVRSEWNFIMEPVATECGCKLIKSLSSVFTR
jgi:hypothetical protein